MAERKAKRLSLADVQIMFRNFEGREGRFNKEGERSFSVALDEALGQQLESEGWNIRWLNNREDEPPLGVLAVKVNFDPERRPPKIVLVTSKGKVVLDAESAIAADHVDVDKADIILNPYHWTVPGSGSGIKAYLTEIWITVRESEFDLKYADLEEITPGGSAAPLAIESSSYEYEDLGER